MAERTPTPPSMAKRWTLACVFLTCLVAHSAWGADAPPGSRETALELIELMGAEADVAAMFNAALEAKIQSNPKLSPYRSTLRTFFEKYMNWDVAAPKLADLYARTFTEPELREIMAFYKSPAGKKMLSKAPVLMAEEMKIVEETFEEHKAQLEEMIRAQAKEAAPQESLLDLANRLYDAGKWAEARDAYVKYLKSDPENVNVITDLGVVHRELGDFASALRQFDRALALNPEHWQALYNKTIVVGFDLKRNAEAQTLLSRLKALQPSNPDVERLAAALAQR
jgi:hypothetical protein